jgi:hypothetical protein
MLIALVLLVGAPLAVGYWIARHAVVTDAHAQDREVRRHRKHLGWWIIAIGTTLCVAAVTTIALTPVGIFGLPTTTGWLVASDLALFLAWPIGLLFVAAGIELLIGASHHTMPTQHA